MLPNMIIAAALTSVVPPPSPPPPLPAQMAAQLKAVPRCVPLPATDLSQRPAGAPVADADRVADALRRAGIEFPNIICPEETD